MHRILIWVLASLVFGVCPSVFAGELEGSDPCQSSKPPFLSLIRWTEIFNEIAQAPNKKQSARFKLANQDEFYKQLMKYKSEDMSDLSKIIYRHLETHPGNLNWIVTAILKALDDRPAESDFYADTLAELRGLYLNRNQQKAFDQTVNSYFDEKAKATEASFDKIKEGLYKKLEKMPILATLNSSETETMDRLAFPSILLDTFLNVSDQNPELSKKLKAYAEFTDEDLRLASEYARWTFADGRKTEMSEELKAFVATHSYSKEEKSEASKMIQQASRGLADPYITIGGLRNPLLELVATAHFLKEHPQIQDHHQYDLTYYLIFLRHLLDSNVLSPEKRKFFELEVSKTEERLKERYQALEPLQKVTPDLYKNRDQVGEKSQSWYGYLNTVETPAAQGASRYFVTWSWALELLADPQTPQWMTKYLKDMTSRLRNPYAIPYVPFAGAPSKALETERGSAARAPMVYYALYSKAQDEKEKAYFRSLLLGSLLTNFAGHRGSLLVRARKSEDGNHELKNLALPGEFEMDGLAPYYLYPTLPWLSQAVLKLEEDPDLSGADKSRLSEFKKQMKLTLMASVTKSGYAIPESYDPMTILYSQCFVLMAIHDLEKSEPKTK